MQDFSDYDLKRQELLEQEMIDSGVERYKRAVTRARAHKNTPAVESNTTYGVGLLKTYVQDVSRQLTRDTDHFMNKAGKGRKPIAWKYLAKLNHDTCAFIACKAILDNISGTSVLSTLTHKIASKIEDQTRLDLFKIQDKKYYTASMRYMQEKQQAETYHKKRKVMLHAATRREDIIRPWVEWPIKDKIHIGNACLEAFIKVTSDYNTDGHRIIGSGMIEKSLQHKGKKSIYMIHGTPKTVAWIQANQDVCQYFTPDFLPCVTEPMDWTSPTKGGYHTKALQARKPMVKMQQRGYLDDMHKRGVAAMQPFYDAVNTLQKTPWEINTFVYTQMLKEFNYTHGIGMPGNEPGEPPARPGFFLDQGNMSEKQWKIVRRAESKLWSLPQKQAYIDWTVQVQKYKRAENARVSEILQVSRAINTARRFAFEDKFYFVWTADFRGRLYASGTAITPQGTDISKGVLRFHNGVKLGENGFKHLCIHTAGTFGNDKCSLDDRVAWVMQNKDLIIQTYRDPDSTRDFWKAADKPYCFLACCEELGQCIQLSTMLQKEFISYIPCAQDGSCNGIQHYSAMLRDVIGAQAVNLMDCEIPADIYIQAANKVLEFIQKSIDTGTSFNGREWVESEPFETQIANAWLTFGIARDCTKKPTMVIPYGGTKIGCRDSCRDYLESFTKKKVEENPDYVNPFIGLKTFGNSVDPKTKERTLKESDPETQAITWLHHLVWHALDEVVIAARVAMKFLRGNMSAIQKPCEIGIGTYVTAPTGFRVYTQIKKTEDYRVRTHLEGEIQLTLNREINEVNKRKMNTSIAPNFVHMLDASHLQMTVNTGSVLGIEDFACIHDSYACHAGNCDILHKAIRFSFKEIHSLNLLERFQDEQMALHPESIKHMPPKSDITLGDFDLENVIYSRHFFR